MIIEIPDSKWRIRGDKAQWALEYPYEDKKTGETAWKGAYFYSALPYAVDKLHELALQESPATVDLRDVPAECKRGREMR